MRQVNSANEMLAQSWKNVGFIVISLRLVCKVCCFDLNFKIKIFVLTSFCLFFTPLVSGISEIESKSKQLIINIKHFASYTFRPRI